MEEELRTFIGSDLAVYTGESCFRGKLIKVEEQLAVIEDKRVGKIYISLDQITAFHKDDQISKGVGFVST
ncbi:hypothetical protein ACFLT7_04615 [candidate division KSB1 bacterium]